MLQCNGSEYNVWHLKKLFKKQQFYHINKKLEAKEYLLLIFLYAIT